MLKIPTQRTPHIPLYKGEGGEGGREREGRKCAGERENKGEGGRERERENETTAYKRT